MESSLNKKEPGEGGVRRSQITRFYVEEELEIVSRKIEENESKNDYRGIEIDMWKKIIHKVFCRCGIVVGEIIKKKKKNVRWKVPAEM